MRSNEETILISSGLIAKHDPEEIYELTDILGKGSHGTVYKAINRMDGTIAAVKKLPDIFQSKKDLKDSLREITILKELNSQFCIEYYNSYFKNGDLWIAMEYFDAGSIGDLLVVKKQALSESQIRMIVYQVLKGLEHLHSRRMIHRDIKAGNVLLNKKGQVKLADFGITTLVSPNEKKSTQIGSPFWMSPELIVGDGYDQKTDIWSLGMTILELAEPFHPFFSQEPLSAVFQIVSGPPPQLTRKEEWSQHFLEFLNLCLDKDPQQRPGATQLLQHQFLNMRPRTNSTYLFASQSESKQTPREKLEEMHSPTTTKKMATPSGGSGNSNSNSSMDCQASNSQLACEYLTAMQERNLQSQQKLAADAKEAVVKIFLQDNSYRSLLLKENEQTTEVIQRLRKKVGEVPMLHTGNLKKSMVPAYSSRFALALLVSSSPATSSSPSSSTTKPAPTEIVMGEHDVPLEAMKQKQDEGELVWLLKEVPDQKAFEELVAVIERYKKMDSDGEESEQTTIENSVARFLAKEGAKELINDFINVLLKPHLSVVSALCSSTSGISQHKMDCIGNALIIVFANHRRLVDLFVKLCSIEVAHTVSITDLFLAGSMIGKMLPAYMKMALQPYLRAVLMPVTQLLFKLDKPLVLDPSITKSKEETKKCISKVKEICRVLIERLFASMPALPLTFRRICQRMHEIVINCWPTKRHIVVQSFLFTKFLCPALVSPQHFGLVDAKVPDKSVFRSSVLVSKTMQAIATGVYFGERERHMAALNKFVKECYPTLAEHFQTIIECKQHLPPTLASRTRMQSKTIGSAPLKDASNSAVNKTEKHIRSSWLSSSPQLQISTSCDSLDAQVRDRPSLSMNSQKRPSLEGPPRSISVECFRTAPKYVEPDAQKRKEREERRRRVEEIERKMKGLPNNTTDTKTQSPPGSPSRLSKSSDDHRYRPQSTAAAATATHSVG
ncbi:TAO kinase 1a [Balamuthia mandrillaris]